MPRFTAPPRLRPAQHGFQICGFDLIHFGHAVHGIEPPLALVIRQDRRGLGVIGFQPRMHGLGLVVGAAGELRAAADIANARHVGA